MITIAEAKRPTTAELYLFLKKHNRLPAQLYDPNAMASYAMATTAVIWMNGEEPLAMMLETPSVPGLLTLNLVPMQKFVSKADGIDLRPEIVALAPQLRDRWFNQGGNYRVQSVAPMAHNQTVRALKSIGFLVESGPSGIRLGGDFGNGPVNIALLGLLPDDPAPRAIAATPAETTTREEASV